MIPITLVQYKPCWCDYILGYIRTKLIIYYGTYEQVGSSNNTGMVWASNVGHKVCQPCVKRDCQYINSYEYTRPAYLAVRHQSPACRRWGDKIKPLYHTTRRLTSPAGLYHKPVVRVRCAINTLIHRSDLVQYKVWTNWKFDRQIYVYADIDFVIWKCQILRLTDAKGIPPCWVMGFTIRVKDFKQTSIQTSLLWIFYFFNFCWILVSGDIIANKYGNVITNKYFIWIFMVTPREKCAMFHCLQVNFLRNGAAVITCLAAGYLSRVCYKACVQ